MEKVLLGAYLSVLAAFITAAASIVKLVNEKESKTTDYRQSWTDSVRSALSQLIGSISLQASYLANRSDIQHRLSKLHKTRAKPEEQSTKDSARTFLIDSLSEINTSIRENRQNIEKYYALTSLHFKPNDETYARVEQKYHQIDELLHKLVEAREEDKEPERVELREKVKAGVAELTSISRHILKTEWEHVKAGEPAYKTTKAWSTYIGTGAFAILVFCGIYLIAYTQVKSNSNPELAPKLADPTIQKYLEPTTNPPQTVQQFVQIEAADCQKNTAPPTIRRHTPSQCSRPQEPGSSSPR